MGSSRLIKKCRECPRKDECDDKMVEALGYLEPPIAATAGATASADIAAPIMVKHDYRDIKISEGVTITIDLEDMKKQIERDFYRELYAGLLGGA